MMDLWNIINDDDDDEVREVILEYRRQTIHDVCNRFGLSYGSCQRTRKSYSKFPKTLSIRFPSYMSYNKTAMHQTVVHDHETKQIHVTLCFPRACYKQRIKANCVT
jgi:hypothetical protein